MFGRQEEAAFNVMPWLASLPVDHLNRHYPSIEEVAWAKQRRQGTNVAGSQPARGTGKPRNLWERKIGRSQEAVGTLHGSVDRRDQSPHTDG
jgi:hypothetical protein